MREIKFRAWAIDHKVFINLDLNEPEEALFGRHGILQNEGFEEWQQFTGLKDKNGKDIYEGDILKRFNELFVVKPLEDGRYSCFYEYADFFDPSDGLTEDDSGTEIVGNIHENPELLQ